MATAMDTTVPRSGVGEGGGGGGLKKGPWTQAEDRVLLDHVRRHGEGNWNAVRRETGLQRCGKSCRLRWANHLRPNLRKGPFSPEEERLILRLHGLIGNKWARISTHLPGRTDNEVKNFWNTRLKRRQRAGQSLYPPDVEREIALMRAQNINPFADADGNTAASPFSDPFALPPRPPSSTKPPSHSHSSPLIDQHHPLLNQMQGMQMRHHAAQHQHPQPAFHHHHHHHHGGMRAAGLPPLPATAARPRELPSNQIETASCSGGGDGLLEALLLGVDDHQLPRPNHGVCRAGSMPDLMYGGVSSASDSDDTSQFPPGGQDAHHGGKWDFLIDDVKPPMRRATSAAENETSGMFGVAHGSISGEWFGTGVGSPGPSSVVTTDDEFGLEMQQLMSSLPLSADELNWNA
ncbi:hypothetical protein CFC21_099711 [Triticum aestivum]|uniref:Uncharacterized protein n=3 Tax=Triticum TaxID=4564 RepID=A0A9R0ZML3_TRITD|nr:transcription factor MYB97-like [Triticum aestivum]KAF7097933.1 hypothetical protein CFC21_099711 [Triticum aestivum]VAI79854.1 unnamed protein product [Triticum turgidum subsp. durum]